ncbi:ATP12-domain-containing protein [Trametopsis cervina]|nr:ATP12-domain-containing protein [Trametopsis cervina]
MQSFALRRVLFATRPIALRCARQLPPIRQWARTQASVATSGPAVTATNRAEVTLKRFWKHVGIERKEDGLVITLDKRSLKTPSGNLLLIPDTKPLAATLIAAEWENQDTILKHHSLPMTSLASRAIDAFEDQALRTEVRAQLIKYLETDTICFLASSPDVLVSLQQTHWIPLLEWARKTFEVEINAATDSFVPSRQPKATIEKFDALLSSLDGWQMAALERATYSSKSFLIGLALTLRHITAEQAAQASHVEVNSQIEKWGEVEDSHDVDYHDIRRQLASAACLLSTL